MPLNLITDSWIPAIRDREQVTLRPDQITEEGVVRPDWPRADLNLACLELLIGLLFLVDPPRNDGDWHERYEKPDSDRLRAALQLRAVLQHVADSRVPRPCGDDPSNPARSTGY